MDTLLLEIGTEEIPAGYIQPALRALAANLQQKMADARIDHGAAKIYGTPRRLTVKIAKVAAKQLPLKTELTGPPVRIGMLMESRIIWIIASSFPTGRGRNTRLQPLLSAISSILITTGSVMSAMAI